MSLPLLDTHGWVLVVLAGFCVGLSKGGLGGVGMIQVLLFATVFPAKESTGMLLLPLIVADIAAVNIFHRHADWRQIRRVLPAALVGIVFGWWCLGRVSDSGLRPLIGGIILILIAVQLLRERLGKWIESTYHSPGFAWALGGLGGWTTMMANAAGPVMSLYFLALRLPKMTLVGTTAWFFCIGNLSKVPFSIQLGIMTGRSLALALLLSPVIVAGVFTGRYILHRISEKTFERLLLLFAIAGSIRLLFPK